MFTEASAIPYEPAVLRGERLLVLAPHPDDEVIACGGLIAQHLRERRLVRVVVMTDGAQAGDRELREEESRRGLARLGEGAALEFLRFPDRALSDEAAVLLREQLQSFRPDLVLVPSPVEIHPDHSALARVFCELIQRDASLFGDLGVTRIAFYEVSSPLRPNAIVDISDVAELKYAAIAEHTSQTALRDYAAYARGLNAYRAMTLPPTAKFAEAYHLVDLASLRITAISELRRRMSGAHDIEVIAETVPISVVVRTKDRPALLREAIDSIRANPYPCQIVVVNDGGVRPELDDVTIVDHEQSRGRSEAANAGVRAAINPFIAFLDDDDLYYPEHLATLAAAKARTPVYTDAVSTSFRPGRAEPVWKLRLFSQDYDPDLLVIDNYIPLPTLLVGRDAFLEAGGFDPAFDLFEDWDFLIRLSARGAFHHIATVTCEVRHFEGGSSVMLAAPEGSPRFREAKLQIWNKHEARFTRNVVANAFEGLRRRAGEGYAELIETKGQVSLLAREVARLEREKGDLIGQIGTQAHEINAYMFRVRELEATVETFTDIVDEFEKRVIVMERLERENDSLHAANVETYGALERARVEMDRLNGLLQMIYSSRTWKLHSLVEKLKGRG